MDTVAPDSMKRVLVLVFDMLHGAPVGSALRTAEFARWLPAFGWEPSILCARGGDLADNSSERAFEGEPDRLLLI